MARARLCWVVLMLGVVLVCGVGVCAGEGALQRDYGVKLCGREFIRAVIFTCGGSRWRRGVEQERERIDQDSPFFLSSYQNPFDRNEESIWTQTTTNNNNQQPSFLSSSSSSSSSSPSLSDLLQAMGEQTQRGPVELDPSEDGLRDGGVRTWLDALFPSGRLRKMDISWQQQQQQQADRKKRNFSLGLAGMCCNQGCTKNDIGRLC
ncbi:prorelaxin H1 [Astyanax mexicanus]|uniref:prorelaxin H1 n=1 Tax=Astyanax mexicanus TaxID=7994 RepID=UPI0020CB080D|nr:prorelaxin H1 [Astyanax mexicanus]